MLSLAYITLGSDLCGDVVIFDDSISLHDFRRLMYIDRRLLLMLVATMNPYTILG